MATMRSPWPLRLGEVILDNRVSGIDHGGLTVSAEKDRSMSESFDKKTFRYMA